MNFKNKTYFHTFNCKVTNCTETNNMCVSNEGTNGYDRHILLDDEQFKTKENTRVSKLAVKISYN